MSDSLAPSEIVAKLIDIGAAKSRPATITRHPAMPFGENLLAGRLP